MKYVKRIIGFILGAIATEYLIRKLTGWSFWKYLDDFFNLIYDSLILSLNYEVKIWHILIFCISIIFIGAMCSFLLKKKERNFNYWEHYTEGTILDIKWRWNWQSNLIEGMIITDLEPVCDTCDMKMEPDSFSNNAQCPQCSNKRYNLPSLSRVRRIIKEKAIKGDYKIQI